MRPFLLLIALIAVLSIAQAGAVPFDATIDGPRNLRQPFTFTLRNLSGTRASVTYHFNVYDFRILNSTLHYWDRDWGAWEELNADPGRVYLAVWVEEWSEGFSYYAYKQKAFPLLWKNYQWIYPEPVLLETIPTVSRDHFAPALIQETTHRITKGIGPLPFSSFGYLDGWDRVDLNPGKSNRYNGFILYEIPEKSVPGDLQVAGSFPMKTPLWKLSPGEINQATPEEMEARIRLQVREAFGRIAEVIRTKG
jgi:hypothetical protein